MGSCAERQLPLRQLLPGGLLTGDGWAPRWVLGAPIASPLSLSNLLSEDSCCLYSWHAALRDRVKRCSRSLSRVATSRLELGVSF